MVGEVARNLVESFTISRCEYLDLLSKEIMYDTLIKLLKEGIEVNKILNVFDKEVE